ncbi:MAG: FtsL-like putative cell division protein [Rikenellaceae bacterium]
MLDEQNFEDLETQAPTPEPKKRSKTLSAMSSVVTGNILLDLKDMGVLRHLIKVIIVIMLYMSNGYSMYNRYREENALKREIKELRAKSVTISSQVMNATRQSEILRELKLRGLDICSSTTPHKVLE